MKEIRIYLEGGGSGNGRALFRNGFKQFLNEQDEKARSKNIRLRVIACGGRNSAIEDFRLALKTNSGACNLLLIDSEEPLQSSSLQNFKDQSGLADLPDDQLHFMVQLMESWYLADMESLQKYYGAQLRASSFPRANNVESIAKRDVEQNLKAATRPTTKGEYHKISHAHKILALLESSRVRLRAPFCERFLTVLEDKVQNA